MPENQPKNKGELSAKRRRTKGEIKNIKNKSK